MRADERGSAPRVLIIEDNADLLGILETVLGDDYVVATARHGEEGVRMAMSFKPDIVILDLQMPEMDGMEAGRRIKDALGDVPIIVLTALAGQGDSEVVMQSGWCDAYLPKPTALDEIRARVDELLASSSGTSSSGTSSSGTSSSGTSGPGTTGSRAPG